MGCNRKFERLFGAEKSDIIGKTDYDLVDKEKADIYRRNDQIAVAAGKPSLSEYKLTYGDDGHTEFVETIKTAMYDADGTLIGVLGVGRDITARKENEIAIKKSKEEWKRTFNAITDIVSLQDKALRIIKINQAGRDALGLGDNNIIGRHCYELFHGSPRPCRNCPLLLAAQTSEPHSREITNEKLGKTFIVSAAPVFDPDGKLTHLTHVAKDITEQKKLEKELFQAQKMESIGTLAGGIAHDFNNILSAIMGFAELAKDKLASGENADRDIDQILRSSTRAAELVRRILTFSRKTDHRLEVFFPHLVVKEALQMLRASLPATVEILERIDEGCGEILADPISIHQVVINLCTNALHAMDNENGRLTVGLYQREVGHEESARYAETSPGTFVVLEIQDTGHGMDQATQFNMFDPFFTTKEVGKGTGLGLSVIHGIVQDYKGFIRVKSQPGVGTTFFVHIPVILSSMPDCLGREAQTEDLLPRGSDRIPIIDYQADL